LLLLLKEVLEEPLGCRVEARGLHGARDHSVDVKPQRCAVEVGLESCLFAGCMGSDHSVFLG
jgi:hypothetical protein